MAAAFDDSESQLHLWSNGPSDEWGHSLHLFFVVFGVLAPEPEAHMNALEVTIGRIAFEGTCVRAQRSLYACRSSTVGAISALAAQPYLRISTRGKSVLLGQHPEP